MSFVIIATMLPPCKIILNFIRMSFVHTTLCYYLHFFLTSSEGALTASLSLSLLQNIVFHELFWNLVPKNRSSEDSFDTVRMDYIGAISISFEL